MQMKSKTPKTVALGLGAAAAKLGWSRWTLSKAADSGAVPYHSLPSGRRYFTEDDLKQIEDNSAMNGDYPNA